MRYEKKQCAGQGQGKDDNKKHCTQATCPICYTFGSIKGNEGGNAGTVSIADAQVLFFPVNSMAGPVWVTTATRLADAKFNGAVNPESQKFVTTLKNRNGTPRTDHQTWDGYCSNRRKQLRN